MTNIEFEEILSGLVQEYKPFESKKLVSFLRKDDALDYDGWIEFYKILNELDNGLCTWYEALDDLLFLLA